MRILHVGPKNFPPAHGGVEKVVYDLVGGMTWADSRVFVEWPTDAPRANVHVLPAGLFRAWRAVRSYALANGVDVVHLHKETFIPLALLLHLGGIRCVLTIHGCAWRLRKWPWPVRAMFLLLDCLACILLPVVVFVGKQDHATFARIGGKRLRWIANGVQADRPASGPTRSGAVYIGRISAEKNVLALAEAAERAGVSLDIYGPMSIRDLAYGQAFQARVERSRRVRYRGPLPADRVPATLARYVTFINPSFAEGLPVAVLEAAAQSLHLVLSDIPAHRTLGFPQCRYINPHDIDLSGADLAPAQPADDNRRHAQAEYGVRKMLLAYEAVYQSMKRRRPAISTGPTGTRRPACA